MLLKLLDINGQVFHDGSVFEDHNKREFIIIKKNDQWFFMTMDNYKCLVNGMAYSWEKVDKNIPFLQSCKIKRNTFASKDVIFYAEKEKKDQCIQKLEKYCIDGKEAITNGGKCFLVFVPEENVIKVIEKELLETEVM